MKRKITLWSLISFSLTFSTFAQTPGNSVYEPPRKEDQFWKRLVVNRIDLDEKMNRPLISMLSPSLYAESEYTGRNGLVAALFQGLKEGHFLAYNANNLSRVLSWEDVLELYKSLTEEDTDTYQYEEYVEEPFEVDSDSYPTDDFDAVAAATELDLSAFERVIETIGNLIFDKNRSDLVYDLEYIRLVWVDPAESLPDENFVCFKYKEVKAYLDKVVWINRFNDAENRSIKEILELHNHHDFVIDVSGNGVVSLEEAEFRRNQLLDFEHHLWSF